MSHTGVDVIDFLFYTIYPVIGIFVVEVISRLVKSPKWIKLWIQALVSIGFGISYTAGELIKTGFFITIEENQFWLILPHIKNFPMTGFVMFALSIALIYQGRRAKISPEKSPY
jgi:hypothetical protein